MNPFGRDDRTLNERLLDDLEERSEDPVVPPNEPKDELEELADDPVAWEVGDYWEVIVGAQDPDLHRESYEFLVLPDGELVVDESCDEPLSTLADAVEEKLDPPYRAVAVRQGAEWWSVSARAAELETLEVEGERLRLKRVDGEVTLTLDGRTLDDPALVAQLSEFFGVEDDDCTVDGVCVDGKSWELRAFVTPSADDDGE